jgi:hypothetical protein
MCTFARVARRRASQIGDAPVSAPANHPEKPISCSGTGDAWIRDAGDETPDNDEKCYDKSLRHEAVPL